MRYAKFYDLTYLFDYVRNGEHYNYNDFGSFPDDYEEEYREKVNEYLKNPVFKDGDIVFIGVSDRFDMDQEYGFYPVKDHKLENKYIFDNGFFLEIPGVYYKKAVEAINKFWFDELLYETTIDPLKEKGMWSMENHIAANTIQKEFRKSRGYAEWAYHPDRLGAQGEWDKINDLHSFGKSKCGLKEINSEILYLKNL